MVSVRFIVAIALVATSSAACWAGKTACRGLHVYAKSACKGYDSQAANSVNPTVAVAQTSGQSGTGFGLTRIAPEQFTNNLQMVANIGSEWRSFDANSGRTIDWLVASYGVSLGGIDFNSASHRDPATKAQTVLVARALAADLASSAVWKDWQRGDGKRQLFTKCDLGKDRPVTADDAKASPTQLASVTAGEARWNAQVDELFWRFYSRPPTDEERASVKAAFVQTLKNEGYPQAGWISVLYALLASEEFWLL